MIETQQKPEVIRSADEIKREKQKQIKQARKLQRSMLNEMYRELGLTKVRGATSGRTYWE